MEKVIVTRSVDETYVSAARFIADMDLSTHVVTLSGDLGSGKTTFAQGILRACRAQGPFTSPTFTIIKMYDVQWRTIKRIYHIDAYRIDSDGIMDIGWLEVIADPHALVIVEWPEMITRVLPDHVITVACQWISDAHRQFIIK